MAPAAKRHSSVRLPKPTGTQETLEALRPECLRDLLLAHIEAGGAERRTMRRSQPHGTADLADAKPGRVVRAQPLLLEHLECGHQPHIQDRGAEERTQLAGLILEFFSAKNRPRVLE